jgi:predicted ATPase/class 3 adenylate cyclase
MSLAQAPRGTLSLVFTDVQGSTTLWDLAPEAMRESMRLHDEILREALRAHDGYEFRTEGDAFKVAFASPLGALRFCCDVQRQLESAAWPDAIGACDDAAEVRVDDDVVLRGLRVRMGAHLGQPDVLEHPTTGRAEYDGPMVNTTARIAALPAGGQVLASRVLWDAARLDARELELVAEDLGRHRLKGLSSPVPLVQVAPPALARRSFPALPSRLAAESNLGPRDDSFVGREPELAQLEQMFNDGAQLVSLVGPGGAGKTRLAVEAGHAQLGAGRSAVWFCDLTTTGDEGDIAETVATALRVPLPATGSAKDARAHVGRMLEGVDDALLLLDNAEQALSAARRCVEAWRKAAPACRFLVTTREPLGAPGERLIDLAALRDDDARRLFVDRARRARPDFDPSEESDAIGEIVERLDGLPLAIELAAARVDVLAPSAIAKRLTQRFRLLSRGGGEARGARATLRGTLDHSWELLSPAEQRALAQCAVFDDGFTVEAAEGVLDLGDDDDAPWPMDVVQDLRRKSLLRTRAEGVDVRLGLYESVRVYAAEKLEELGDREDTERRHSAFYASAATRWLAGINGRDDIACLRRLHDDLGNLIAVWHRERERDPARALLAYEGAAMTHAMEPRVGVLDEATQAVEVARALDDPNRLAAILLRRAEILRIGTQVEDSVRDLEEAVKLLESGSPDDLAFALRELALAVSHVAGREADALALLDRADAAVGDGAAHAMRRSQILETRTWMYVYAQNYEAAESMVRESLALADEAGAQWQIASCQTTLGMVLAMLGRRHEGSDFLALGGGTKLKAGDRRSHLAKTINDVAMHVLTGEIEAAERAQEEARVGLAPLPAPGLRAAARAGEGMISVGRARVADAAGDAEGARAHLAQAHALVSELRALKNPGADDGSLLIDRSVVLRTMTGLLEEFIAENAAELPSE